MTWLAGDRLTTRLPVLAGLLILAGIVSVLQRQDNNWDLWNYHLYVPYAAIEGRLSQDLFVTSIQSYLNPLIDMPYYLAAVKLLPSMPRTVAFLAGLPYGVLVFLVIEMARAFPRGYFPSGPIGFFCAVLIGISGTIVWAEVGTTFGDITIAILVIGGILPVLRLAARPAVECPALERPAVQRPAVERRAPERAAVERPAVERRAVERRAWFCAAACSGLLIGMAIGLKLTAAVFAPPLALGVAVSTRRMRWVLPACALVTAGGVIGFAITYGWWGWTVWRLFGSPVFPYLNDIFHSPLMPAMTGRDVRYLPSGLWQAVFFPFTWLAGRAWVVAEIPVRDPRFALAWLSVVSIGGLAVGAWTVRTQRLRDTLAALSGERALGFLLVFFVGSFALWEWYFAYLRYILPLEALSGIVIVTGIKAWTCLVRPASARVAHVSLAVVVVLVIAGSLYSHWGRAKTWDQQVFAIEAPVLPDGSRVIAASDAVSFVLPFLHGKDLTFVGLISLPTDSGLAERLADRLAGDRPVYALTYDEEGLPRLRQFGWDVIRGRCTEVENDRRRGILLCPAQRIASADLRSSGPVDQRSSGPADQRASGPVDQRASASADQRSNRPGVQRISGSVDQRTNGSVDQRTSGPADQRKPE
jgi:hypothetical protein